MLSLIFMTSRVAQSPPKLFNMDAVEADTYTHIHTSEHSTCVRAHTHTHIHIYTQTRGHKCTNARLHTHKHTHTFFLPQRQCMAGVLLLLMMKSGSDSAALSRVDALQHSAAMLRKFSVSPH